MSLRDVLTLQCTQAVYDRSSNRKCASAGKWKREVWLLQPQQAPHKSTPVTQRCLPRLLMDLPTTMLLPSTPTREKSQARYSAQLANGLGVPSSLFVAHLAPVRWWRHVHSSTVSLNGVDTERWGRDASQERLFSLFVLIHIHILHIIHIDHLHWWHNGVISFGAAWRLNSRSSAFLCGFPPGAPVSSHQSKNMSEKLVHCVAARVTYSGCDRPSLWPHNFTV